MCEVVYVKFDHTRILVVPCKSLGRGRGRREEGREKKWGDSGKERERKKGRVGKREGEEIERREDEKGGEDKQGDKGITV